MDLEKDENWQQLVAELAKLSPKQKAHLALNLSDTLAPPDQQTPDEVSEALDVELARRVEGIQSGKVQGIPAAKIFPGLGHPDS